MKLVYKFLLPAIVILFGGFYFLLDKTVSSKNEVVGFLQDSSKELLLKQLKQREESELKIQNDFLDFSADSIANISSNFVINYDIDGLSEKLKYYFNIKSIKVISVYDTMGSSYFITIYKDSKKLISSTSQKLPDIINDLKSIKKDMISENENIGFVNIYYDDNEIINKIKQTKQNVLNELKNFTLNVKEQRESSEKEEIAAALIILIILIFIIIVLSYRFVLNPLKLLQDGLEDFFLFLQNKKDNAQNISISSNDEFGQMANSLNENISVSAKLHEEIYELNTNLEARIKEKTAKVTTLLDNAGQGFLTFDENFIIDEEYSKECIKLMGSSIANNNITDLLFTTIEKKEFFKSTLLTALEETIDIKRNSYISLLPSIILLNKKAVKLEYKILQNNHFMLILTNITSQKKLEKKIKKEQEVLKMIVSIVSEPDTFYEIKDEYKEFINSYEDLIDTTKTPLHNISNMYRTIHTYKGIFSQLYMQDIANHLHDLESDISKMIQETIHSNNDLLELFKNNDFDSSLEKSLDIIKEILGEEFLNSQNFLKIDFTDIQSLQEKISNILDHKVSTTPECQDILSCVQNLSSQKLITLLNPYISLTQQLASRLEKEIYEFDIVGDKNLIVSDKFKPFVKSLIHLFRNSIDHGIETPEVRVDNGKDEKGTILCSFKEEDENLYLTISDDGAGIDINKIKEKLLSKGINTDNLSDQKIYEFIFNDNFTTKDDISDISGRGIGTSAVKHELEKLNGDIKIISQKNIGTTFEFVVPL